MSDRVTEFLDHWEAEHVNSTPPEHRREEAERLARECVADARRVGIGERELEAAADGGSLLQNMLNALQWVDERNGNEAAN
jgi:hypothetical protein